MDMTRDPRRVFIVDDHPIILAGVTALVDDQDDFEVVGTSSDVDRAIVGIEAAAPELVIVDLSLPNKSGLLLLEWLQRVELDIHGIVLTVHEEVTLVQQALQLGARGFVLKRSAADELIRAMRSVVAGGIYLDPAVASKLVRLNRGVIEVATALSDREAAVVRLVAKGFSNKEISSQLALSVKTIETYRSRAAEKLGLRTRAALVRYATLEGWMTE